MLAKSASCAAAERAARSQTPPNSGRFLAAWLASQRLGGAEADADGQAEPLAGMQNSNTASGAMGSIGRMTARRGMLR